MLEGNVHSYILYFLILTADSRNQYDIPYNLTHNSFDSKDVDIKLLRGNTDMIWNEMRGDWNGMGYVV